MNPLLEDRGRMMAVGRGVPRRVVVLGAAVAGAGLLGILWSVCRQTANEADPVRTAAARPHGHAARFAASGATSASPMERARQLRLQFPDAEIGEAGRGRLRTFAGSLTPAQLTELLEALRDDRGFFGLALRAAAIGVLGETQPKAAALFLVELPEHAASRGELLESLFTAWAGTNPQDLAAALTSLPAGGDRRRAGTLLASHLPAGSLPAYAGVIDAAFPEGADRDAVLRCAVIAMTGDGQRGLTAVRKWFDRLSPGLQGNAGLLSAIVESLDPSEAALLEPFLGSLPASPGKTAALAALIGRYGVSDPGMAAKYAGQHPDHPESSALVSRVARDWAAIAPQDAAAWAQNLGDPAQSHAAMQGAVAAWARDNPVEAGTWAANLTDEAAQRTAVFTTVDIWAGTAPEAAARWVLAFSPSLLQADGMSAVLSQWARADRQGAVAFIASLSPGSVRDAAQIAMDAAQAADPAPPRSAP